MISPERRLPRALLVLVLMMLSLGLMVVTGCNDDDEGPTGGGGDDTTSTDVFKSSDFQPASECKSCHPQYYDEWIGSAHAYTPYNMIMRKLSDIGRAAYPGALDQGCVQCHLMIGSRAGETPYEGIDYDNLPEVTMDGVGCDMCHTVTSIGGLENGAMNMTPGHTKYGTTQDPIFTPAHDSEYRSLYKDSEYCGACHDIVMPNGLELEETFREWRSKGFEMTGKTCNECHMEAYQGKMTPSSPIKTLHRHDFPGVDIQLVAVPGTTPAHNEHQDSLRTELLENAVTMTLNASSQAPVNLPFTFSVDITNDKTGHSVPSGAPMLRQMWLDIVVKNAGGSIVWSTGQLDANNDLMDEDSEFGVVDSSLWNTTATMYRGDGVKTGFTWQAEIQDNPAITAGETRQVEFTIPGTLPLGTYTIEVKLNFRTHPPAVLRSLELDDLLPLRVIEMETASSTFDVIT